ncbi:MAG: metal ABC transporter ATP-binding protein [Muribaculaceae bacterium]|nr:metal ABC transporter ATP-binding protein [Muribaculaceae bacterium]
MPPVIQLSDINMRWEHKTVLSNVSLTVNKGDFLAVTGPNGGGKTTLLRIILKLLAPTSGTVTYLRDGVACRRLPIGYLPQKNMIDSRFPISVREVIASGLLGTGITDTGAKNEAVEETIKLVELQSHATTPIGNLSGGQLQRALLGRAIISKPEIMVLDEPLSYIDKHFEDHIYRIIADVAPNTTIILVSHEMSVISTMANRHLIVDHSLHECAAHRHFMPTDCR